MGRILAIEPDPERARTLKRFLHERVRADVVVVESKDAAISAIAQQVPDLMLTPALLSPQDDADLTSHLKQLPHLQVLTIPPLAEPVEASTAPTGMLALFRRRNAKPRPVVDSSAVVAQIVDYLEQARALQAQREVDVAQHDGLSATFETTLGLQLPASNPQDERDIDVLGATGTREDQALSDGSADERRRNCRRTRGEVPWLSTVKLPWGLEVCLLNISSTGMLVETTSKLPSGGMTEFQLCGPDTTLVVPARFVRSEVARVDYRSVKYHVAAAFARELDFPAPPGAARSASTQKALAELLTRVLADLDRGGEHGELRTRFEQGLRKLVPARDIQIRDVPVRPGDGTESIYFTVPSGLGSGAILQATFEADCHLAELEFRLLKSAAALAAVVLEFEKTA